MKTSRITRSILLTMCLLVIVVMPLLAAGCNNSNQLDAGATEISQQTSGASVAIMDANGNQSAAFHGMPPMHMKQDDQGNWVTVAGTGGIMTFDPATGKIFLFSPANATMTDVKFTPQPDAGEPAFSAESISFNISEVLAQHVGAITVAMATLEGMTRVEAEATVAKWVAAGDMLPTVADVVMQLIAVAF